MRQKPQFQIVRISPWQFWLAVVFTLAVVTAIAVLTAGLLLILAPIALIAALLYRIMAPTAPRPGAGDPGIIDAQYTVIDESSSRDDKNGGRRQ
jgi:hypothetical protein